MIFRAVEDADLISRVRRGNVEAFNLLVSCDGRSVSSIIFFASTGRPDDALDLTQDAFLKAWQSIRKLDDPARFGPWLYRIAHNEAYSLFRRRRPETGLENAHLRRRNAAPGFPVDLSLAVTAALDRLNADQREAVVLKVYEGLKFEEMAEVLGCPVSTVKSRLYTALDLMKTELAPVSTREVNHDSPPNYSPQ